MFILSGVILVLMMLSFFTLSSLARFAILEIKEKEKKLYKEIIKRTDTFPETDLGAMDADDQVKLYVYLFTGKNGIKNIVPQHQKWFRFFATLFILLLIGLASLFIYKVITL